MNCDIAPERVTGTAVASGTRVCRYERVLEGASVASTSSNTSTLSANVALPPVSGYTDSNPANNSSSKQTTVGGL